MTRWFFAEVDPTLVYINIRSDTGFFFCQKQRHPHAGLQIYQVVFFLNVPPPGASTAGVHGDGPDYGAKPGDRGQGALLSREDPTVPHAHRLHGHHYDGENGIKQYICLRLRDCGDV